ncbi:PQQ-dependent sugar dehydrogenase [Dokdonia sp. Hel_I_53]|uniref:PQQ-dependent sugar dehydrogenase n=1 Tax=Dokdonia sp. Hel_I_53 TaxID=1566287 RepID=UPI00119931B6|nr:PQQ-dependent sugar dehydrogenase [Dokdonia sp. Hel_I_53]TVZ53240.1 glucose/arabinose dehydrogenase [Dokdonia sp. Hel_I_53]
MKNHFIYMLVLFLGTVACAQKQRVDDVPLTSNTNYTYEVIVSELTNPWGLEVLPDGSMLITEKSGELIHFKNGKKTLVANVPEVVSRGQGGLLDIRLHPDYESNGWIYFTYSSPEGEEDGAMTALMRAKLVNNTLIKKELLYKGSPNTRKGQHFGSRVRFDKNGDLFFSIGERGERDANPQDITRDGGKIYRLYDDGSVPKDNPFVRKADAKEAIYSYGHRNPQGIAVHPETGKIWIHEHGPRGGDEINIPESGKNYGWPVISYGVNYSGTSFTDITKKEGMEQPLYYWVPSIAPSGMAFAYETGDKHLDGNLLIGSLKFEYLELDILKEGRVVAREKLLEDIGRVRNVINHNGTIYVGVEGKGIVKLIKK